MPSPTSDQPPLLTFATLLDLLDLPLPPSDPNYSSDPGPLGQLLPNVPIETSDFKDTRYRNLRSIGLSLQFAPRSSGPGEQAWHLSCIDVYNEEKGPKGWSAFAGLPLTLSVLVPSSSDSGTALKACELEVTRATTGADFVRALGEPTRKGGGEAAAGGVSASGWGPGAYCEWNAEVEDEGKSNKKITILVELAGPAARGHDRWEAGMGGKAVWSYLMLAKTE